MIKHFIICKYSIQTSKLNILWDWLLFVIFVISSNIPSLFCFYKYRIMLSNNIFMSYLIYYPDGKFSFFWVCLNKEFSYSLFYISKTKNTISPVPKWLKQSGASKSKQLVWIQKVRCQGFLENQHFSKKQRHVWFHL